jgi:hypothetical protein
MTSIPSVKRMVMFKHGVAYLERSGAADGPFELSFKREEMNDVLKSLAVWVAEGDARIGALAFERPENPEDALAKRKLVLNPGAALHDMLMALRGRKVRLHLDRDSLEGEIIGVDDLPNTAGTVRRTVLLKTTAGAVGLQDVAGVQSIELLEPSSRADIDFLVDRSRAATGGDSRIVRIDLVGIAKDVHVSYVIPAPVWRMSYRFARNGDETLLMGWAIVHNPADEDLNDIELTLTTGQPLSFVIDLYNPKNVARTVIEEPTRGQTQVLAVPQASPGFAVPVPAMTTPSIMAAAVQTQQAMYPTDTVRRTEQFEYQVQPRVSLKRRGSAMVPIVSKKLDIRKERIWRLGSQSSPDLLLAFTNDTGAVLEEGPAVIYDNNTYAGEAMVPYSARGMNVRLCFAKDLSVRCGHSSTSKFVIRSVTLTDAGAVEEWRREEHHELFAQSDHEEEVEVIFEVPKQPGKSLSDEYAQPFEDALNYWRFRGTVPAGGSVMLTVVLHEAQNSQFEYRQIEAQQLERWVHERLVDSTTCKALEEVRTTWLNAKRLEERRTALQQTLDALYAKQGRISEKLSVLKDSGAEGDLRLRYVRELGDAQDHINASEIEIARLRESSGKARHEADSLLQQLVTSNNIRRTLSDPIG